MNTGKAWHTLACSASLLIFWALFGPSPARAHCDTLDGPVVTAARAALAKGEITPVLGWIGKDQEDEVREAFNRTLAVRRLGPEAQELADRYFFETVVRLHRAGEGEPFTGLKPAGTPVDPAVAASDKALATGSIDGLVSELSAEVAAGLRLRFERAMEKKRHAGDSVEAARAYVAAYVELTHYAERLHLDARESAGHGTEHGHDLAHR
jgi:uncharacterized protein DUF6448